MLLLEQAPLSSSNSYGSERPPLNLRALFLNSSKLLKLFIEISAGSTLKEIIN